MSLTFCDYIFISYAILILIFSVFIIVFIIKKNKIILYLGIAFSIACFLIITLSFIKHQIITNNLSKDIPGLYLINLENSEFNNSIDSSKYKNLTIEFTPNRKFQLNMDVPFLKGNSGSWNYFFDGEIAYGEIIFSKDSKEQFDHDGEMVNIICPMPKYGNKQVHLLYFNKIK